MALTSFHPKNNERADDEGESNGHGLKKIRLDQLAEGKSQHGSGNERNEEIHREALRGAIRSESRQHATKLGAVFPDDREHRTGLDHDFEDLSLLVVEAEQIARENQVASGGDRQKFCQTFDDAENKRFREQSQIQSGLPKRKGRQFLAAPSLNSGRQEIAALAFWGVRFGSGFARESACSRR